jgi:SSS family solute:Na+ symporter
MFVPFIVILPGIIAAVLVPEMIDYKADPTAENGVTYNDAILLLIRDVLPNGLLGVAIAGLLAAFMAGMAANISSFNTVFSYDLWQQYVKKDRPDEYYLKVGRLATVGATVAAIGTALIAAGYNNLMDYLQTLFGFFNAPLFATFILGMFWKRMTPTAGWVGLVAGTAAAVTVDRLVAGGVLDLPGQGGAFVAAAAAFVVDIVVSIGVSMVTTPKPASELAGLVYSETPKEVRTDPEAHRLPWYQAPAKLAAISLVMVIVLNVIFR